MPSLALDRPSPTKQHAKRIKIFRIFGEVAGGHCKTCNGQSDNRIKNVILPFESL